METPGKCLLSFLNNIVNVNELVTTFSMFRVVSVLNLVAAAESHFEIVLISELILIRLYL